MKPLRQKMQLSVTRLSAEVASLQQDSTTGGELAFVIPYIGGKIVILSCVAPHLISHEQWIVTKRSAAYNRITYHFPVTFPKLNDGDRYEFVATLDSAAR